MKAASKDLKDNPELAKQSIAYQALLRISSIYKLEGTLKDLSPEERLKERQANIKPLVDEYFAWVKTVLNTMLPKGKTASGLNYSINQEKQLRVFLKDGEVPIDNSASERAIRTFCVGKKNWLFFDSIHEADSGAAIYSITETVLVVSAEISLSLCKQFKNLSPQPKIFDTVQSIKVSLSNIIENPDGTTSRKHTKYSGKRVVRETVDIEQLQYDLGFEEIIPPQD